jgi:uncharacterized protein YuzE
LFTPKLSLDRYASSSAMSLKAGPHEFTEIDYDPRTDVLYARNGEVPEETTGWLTPEGTHTFTLDPAGSVIGMDLINPSAILEREGTLRITLPSGERVEVEGLESSIEGGA